MDVLYFKVLKMLDLALHLFANMSLIIVRACDSSNCLDMAIHKKGNHKFQKFTDKKILRPAAGNPSVVWANHLLYQSCWKYEL